MTNRMHSVLLSCCVASSLVPYVNAQVAVTKKDNRLPAHGILSYPDRIPFPSDLTATELSFDKDDQPKLRFPFADYSVCHYNGWQLYLERFGRNNEPMDMKWKDPLVQTVGIQQRAMKDGFEACKQAVKSASQRISIDSLRVEAKRVYFPNTPPTPPNGRENSSPAIAFPTPK